MTDARPKRDIIAEMVADSIRGYAYAMANERMAIHQCRVHEDHEACAEIAKYTDQKFEMADMMANGLLELARLRARPPEAIEVDIKRLKEELRGLKKRLEPMLIPRS